MNLLTWHGTVVRVDPASGRWLHAAPWPWRPGARDLTLSLPPGGLSAPMLLEGDLVAEPGPARDRIVLRRGDAVLRAELFHPFLFEGLRQDSPHEHFVALPAGVLARLRGILGRPARIAGTDAPVTAAIEPGFLLSVGGLRLALAAAVEAGPDGLSFPDGQGGAVVLRPDQAGEPPEEIRLWPRGDAPVPAHGVRIGADQEVFFPPLTVGDADQIWMQRNQVPARIVRFGAATPSRCLRRADGAYVLNTRGQEGIIFDEHGVLSEGAGDLLQAVGVHGAGPLAREADDVFLPRRTLAEAQDLPGAHVVFCAAEGLTNYYHWLIESLLPLRVMAPHLPQGTRLLLPGAMRDLRSGEAAARTPDYDAMLRDWGLAGMPATRAAAPVCRCETVFWLDGATLDGLSAADLAAARAAFRTASPRAGPARRILISRAGRRRLANQQEIASVLRPLGFETAGTAGMAPAGQAALFRGAEIVVAPHGAELANLLFCEPGTIVLEISPDCEFRSYYARMSSKLGLRHAILPAPTLRPGFDSDMVPDPARLRLLLDQAMARS